MLITSFLGLPFADEAAAIAASAFAVCLRDQCKVVWVKNSKTLLQATQQV